MAVTGPQTEASARPSDAPLPRAARGAALVFVGAVGSAALAFIAKVLLARATSTSALGIYSLALAVASIVSLLGTMGMFEGATRSISHALGSDNLRDAFALSRATEKLSIRSGTVCGILLWLAAEPFAEVFIRIPELVAPLRVIAVSVPFAVLAHNLGAIMRAYNALKPVVLISTLGNPLLQLLGVVLCAAVGLPLLGYLWSYVLAAIVICVLLARYAHRRVLFERLPGPSPGLERQLLHSSLPLLVVSVLSLTLSWIDVLMLGRYTNASTVGVYSASVSLARLLAFPLTSMVFALTPICVRLLAQDAASELTRTYQITTKWIFAATLVPFFFLFFFPEWSLQVVFGDRFVGAASSLRLLSLGLLFSAFFGGNAMLMIVHGMTRELMVLAVLGVLIGVVSNYVLIHVLGYGAAGAAAATMTTYTLVNAITSVFLYRQRRIQPFTRSHCGPAAILPLLGLLVYAIKVMVPWDLVSISIGFAIFYGGYLNTMWRMGGLRGEDWSLITGLFAKVRRTKAHRLS